MVQSSVDCSRDTNKSFLTLEILFILFMGFLRQKCWSGLPFPSPVDHILSGLSTMTCPPWVALHSMAHSFIELDKAVVHVSRLVSFLWGGFQSVCPWPTSIGSWKKQESSRKTSTSALLTMPKPFTVDHHNCRKFLKRWEHQTTRPASLEICMQVRSNS